MRNLTKGGLRYVGAVLLAGAVAVSCDDEAAEPESVWRAVYSVGRTRGIGVGFVAPLWFTSPQEGWAGLGDVVARYDGAVWRTVTDFGDADPGWYYYINAVSAPAAGEVWVGGNRRSYQNDEVAYVLKRYDGKSWHDVAIPGIVSSDIATIYFAGPDTGWVGCVDGVFRYDHGTWTRQYEGWVTRITASEPGDLWALEHTASGDDLVRGDGQTWTRQYLGDYFEDYISIRAFAFAHPANGWVAGEVAGLSSGNFLMHFDGQRWKLVVGSEAAGAWACDFYDIRAGWFGGQGFTVFYDGCGFDNYTLPADAGGWVFDLAVTGREDAWATTAAGPNGPFYVLHFDGF